MFGDLASVLAAGCELCSELGFCLSLENQARLAADPPDEVDAFTDAVIRAEGLDPRTIDLRLRRDVKARVRRYFAEEEA